MDVRLPDGTLLRGVPDNISKADLVAKLKNNGYDTSKLDAPVAAPVAPPADVPESMLSRVANAPLELAKMQGRALMAAPGPPRS